MTLYAFPFQRFGEIAPEADEINLIVSETVELFHCGVNFERVLCPSCGAEILVAPDEN